MESGCCAVWKSQGTHFQLLCAMLGAAFGWSVACCHRPVDPRALPALRRSVTWLLHGSLLSGGDSVIRPLSSCAALSRWTHRGGTWKEQNSDMTYYLKSFLLSPPPLPPPAPFHSRRRRDAVYSSVRTLPIVNWKLGRKDDSTTSKTTRSSSETTFSGFRTSYLIIINDPIVQNTIRTCLRKRQRWHYFPWSLLIEIPPDRRIIWVEIYLEPNNE